MATGLWPLNWPPSWSVLPPPPPGKGPVPNGLEPGDIILCCPSSPNNAQKAIISAQLLLMGVSPHINFTHAAIYRDNGMAFDSTRATNISLRPYEDIAAGAHIRARRFRGATPTMQWDLCATATQFRGKYNLLQATTDALIASLAPTLSSNWQQALRKWINGTSDPMHRCTAVNSLMRSSSMH